MRNRVTGTGISHILILTGLCEQRLFQYVRQLLPTMWCVITEIHTQTDASIPCHLCVKNKVIVYAR